VNGNLKTTKCAAATVLSGAERPTATPWCPGFHAAQILFARFGLKGFSSLANAF